jgi:hypothetical protein
MNPNTTLIISFIFDPLFLSNANAFFLPNSFLLGKRKESNWKQYRYKKGIDIKTE